MRVQCRASPNQHEGTTALSDLLVRLGEDCMMTISREQAQALTRLVHLLRPAWNEEGIYAAVTRVKDRDAYDVALAAIRAAADKGANTPGVIPSPGPHWNEAAPVEPK